jgi:hypothetical protein
MIRRGELRLWSFIKAKNFWETWILCTELPRFLEMFLDPTAVLFGSLLMRSWRPDVLRINKRFLRTCHSLNPLIIVAVTEDCLESRRFSAGFEAEACDLTSRYYCRNCVQRYTG